MTTYNYIAIDTAGRRIKGVLNAESECDLRGQLRELNLQAISMREVGFIKKKKASYKLATQDLVLITRQLSILVSASVPLDDVFYAVAKQHRTGKMYAILMSVRGKLLEGHSLSEALGCFPGAFPKLYRASISAAESSGDFGMVLDKLADYIEQQYVIKQQTIQALLYPGMMIAVALFVVTFLLIYVVPKIVNIFSASREVLPFPTIVLLKISHYFSSYGLISLISMVVIIFLILFLLKKKKYKNIMDRIILRIPFLSKLIIMRNTARFSRTLGIFCQSGVPIIQSLKSSLQLISLYPIHDAINKAISQVEDGETLFDSLSATNYFSPLFLHLVMTGEKTARLPDMLLKAASQQERDVKLILDRILTLFEPALILVMGLIVLFIVLAIMLPIFSLDSINF